MGNTYLFSSKRKSFFPRLLSLALLIGCFICTSSVYAVSGVKEGAQSRTVNGNITDELGEVLIGVTVKVVGASTGTISDVDGNYTISVPNASASLEFSYVGYSTQVIQVGEKTQINVVMKTDAKVLDQVVVTALGMKRSEKALGYAMTEIKGDDLNTSAINPVSALQGKAAGVEISGTDGGLFGSTKIQIRGASTLTGNNQPIYVVDGVILENSTHDSSSDWSANSGDYGNELKNLNPDDFESISILKGSAATALYGSRGLKGAIVITTKGGGKQKGLGVSVTQSIGFDKANTFPDLQTEYGQGSMAGWIGYGNTWKDENGNDKYYQFDTNQFNYNLDGKPSLIGGGSGVYWGPRYDGREIELYDKTYGNYNGNKNFYKDMYKTGFSNNTNIIVKGGNGKTSFYNSLGYRYAEGIVENNTFWRLSNMLKASHEINDRVTINGSMTFAISKPKNPQTNMGDPVYNGDIGGSYDADYYKHKYRGDVQSGMASTSYGDTYGSVPGKSLWWSIYENRDVQKETVVRPTLDVNVKITDWVSFKGEGNMNYYFAKREVRELGTGYNNEGGKFMMQQEEKRQETLAGTFTFNKSLNDFYIGGFARGEFYNFERTYLKSETSGGLIVPGQYFIQNSKNPVVAEGKISGKKRILSTIFAANFGWKNQIYLDVTGRNDWSSALVYADGTGNYSYFYPSVSGSWLITESLKDKLPEWISFMKVRGSWAQVGNDTDPYNIQQGYDLKSYLQSSGGSIYVTSAPSKLYQVPLKPERKNSWEIGLDWRFLDNRINLDATYYKENTKDQIIEIDLPYESGVNKQLVNAGNIQNSGIELALNTVPFRNKDWEWTLDFTYTRNRSKIKEMHPNVQNFVKLQGDATYGNYRIASVAKVNGAYGLLMTDSNPLKDKDGQLILNWSDKRRTTYYERDGQVSPIGDINPDFYGSIATGLRFKDFTFRALIDMRYGGLIASYSNRYGTAYGMTESSLAYRDAEHGGITWTSKFEDTKGQVFHDGVIPEGKFKEGQIVTTPAGIEQNVGGMTFREAYEAGYVEPVHASAYWYMMNNWGQGVVNDSWVHEVKYIALREISVGYRVPRSFCNRLGLQGANLNFSARNLGYLYNSLPNNLNPESVRGSVSAAFRERGLTPNTASYTFTIGFDF